MLQIGVTPGWHRTFFGCDRYSLGQAPFGAAVSEGNQRSLPWGGGLAVARTIQVGVLDVDGLGGLVIG
jgi:hypothetical protein